MLSFEFLLRLSAILKLDFLKSPGKSGSARPPRDMKLGNSRPFWITSFGFVKVYRIPFSIWENFIGFYIYCYPITTILTCLFFVGVRISWKKLCWMRAWRRRWHLVSPALYIIILYRVNLNKLSRNFVEAIRTTTTNCRVSFIDLYLVFLRNFRIVFLPHTNTLSLLEPYCGTITEPGLPVRKYVPARSRSTVTHAKGATIRRRRRRRRRTFINLYRSG